MECTMKKSEKLKHLAAIQAQHDIANFKADLTRARSVTVGTAFGGVTEISLRGSNGDTLWCLLQPVEVIELIHQLSANVGCHIALKPREDFSSWRGWKVSDEERLLLKGHAPFAGEVPNADNMGANLPPPEQQPGLKLNRSNDDVVAIKKTVNGRSTKRAPKPA